MKGKTVKDKLLHTPEGVRDIYGKECQAKLYVESQLLAKMKLYGFESIETPTFEYFDIFSEERGSVSAKDMYKFFDREGNTLVLRPDITPSIARCIAKYYRDCTEPVRLSYHGKTFINSSEYQGKPKEVTQIGGELVNDSSAEADAEMIALTIDCLLAAGLTEFQVEIGEVGFFKAVMSEAGLAEDDIDEIRLLINDKNTFGLEDLLRRYELDEKLAKLISDLPTLFGPPEKLADFKARTENKDAIASIARLEKIYSLMKLYGYERYISFDLGMLSKYRYYTGIIFNAYSYGTGDAIISGGRYDNLLGQFEKPAPAIGMAVVVDRLMDALSRQGIAPDTDERVKEFEASKADYENVLKKAVAARRAGIPARIRVR
ncbi:MAG: ATP phosphoribosyltransferase regulatory subunit [Lachnospiraceae bacterium]|nr:ATP phosphoribosyltransferase regulatory subunit [Lachnospiraceae bacterium]MBR5732067.1 ATP phosphoribosyltransferase regulatory subunit [Lachnospiraceae bacterium]